MYIHFIFSPIHMLTMHFQTNLHSSKFSVIEIKNIFEEPPRDVEVKRSKHYNCL